MVQPSGNVPKNRYDAEELKPSHRASALSKSSGRNKSSRVPASCMLRLIADHANHNPAAFALLAPGRVPLTYARLHAEIQQHAHVLSAFGIGKEDRVALLLPNGPEAAVGFLATSAICVCAPLNFVYTANELDAALSPLKPKVLIASPQLDAEKRAVAGED